MVSNALDRVIPQEIISCVMLVSPDTHARTHHVQVEGYVQISGCACLGVGGSERAAHE